MSAMHVISASRRTDIPAFYTPWLLRRLAAGYVRVPNPFNSRQISTIDLKAANVACLVFWTKDPRPLLPHLIQMEQSGYRFIFHVTLTGLPSALEPDVPPWTEIAEAVRTLSCRIGAERIVWRYDPVLISCLTPEDRLRRNFSEISQALEGQVRRVTISFARYYRQVQRRLRLHYPEIDFLDLARLSAAESLARIGPLAAELSAVAASRGMEIVSCAEPLDLSPFGVSPAPCIDADHLRSLFGLSLSPRKDPGQRPECGCIRTVDIGIYGTCRHRCLYCYARSDAALVRGERHDPCSARLIGEDPGMEGPSQASLF
jgi:hypothetical protein